MTQTDRPTAPVAVDGQHFEALVQSHRGKWLAVARRLLADPVEAEDIVQETIARVWALSAPQQPRNLDAYICTAVRMNALKYRARRRQWSSLEHEPLAVTDDSDPLSIEPATLERAILDLPPRQQAVIRMKYYTGMTFAEISKSMSISINTAAGSCRYALKNLRRALAAKQSDE